MRKRTRTSTANILIESQQATWKRRPSEIRGYTRAYYLNDDNGDYLRVDYNLRENRVRLYVEIDAEGGNAYYSVISNGKITAEKSVSTGRNFGFGDKFRSRAEEFGTLPNREVLKLINRNYGISKTRVETEDKGDKKKRLEETRKRYFKKGEIQAGHSAYVTERISWKVGLVDIIDILIGIVLSGAAFFYFRFSYIALGTTAAFFGIIAGFVDMLIRGRAPVFIKVMFFLFAGIAFFIYGYFL